MRDDRRGCYRRYETAVGDRDAPFAVVDLDALHANADCLRGQAGGLPVRVASKSVRCVEVLRRVLAMRRLARGVLAFTPAEACHLAAAGIDDLLVAYPSVDRGRCARSPGGSPTAGRSGSC